MSEKTLIVKVDLSCHRCNKKIKKVLDKYKDQWDIKKIEFDEKDDAVKLTGPFDIELLKKKLCCKACEIIKDFIIPETPKPLPAKPIIPPTRPPVAPPTPPPICPTPPPVEPPPPPPVISKPPPPPVTPPTCTTVYPYPYPYPYPFPIQYPCGSCKDNRASGCGCSCGSPRGCSKPYEPEPYCKPACRLVYEEEGPSCSIM